MILKQDWNSIEMAAWRWHEAKLFVEHSIGFSLDALHVLAGVIVLIAVALLLRKPISNGWPWSIVLAATLANELVDLWVEQWPSPGMQYGESAKDLLLTMFVPTLLLLTARKLPGLYR